MYNTSFSVHEEELLLLFFLKQDKRLIRAQKKKLDFFQHSLQTTSSQILLVLDKSYFTASYLVGVHVSLALAH